MKKIKVTPEKIAEDISLLRVKESFTNYDERDIIAVVHDDELDKMLNEDQEYIFRIKDSWTENEQDKLQVEKCEAEWFFMDGRPSIEYITKIHAVDQRFITVFRKSNGVSIRYDLHTPVCEFQNVSKLLFYTFTEKIIIRKTIS